MTEVSRVSVLSPELVELTALMVQDVHDAYWWFVVQPEFSVNNVVYGSATVVQYQYVER